MKPHRSMTSVRVILVAVFLLALSVPAWSQEEEVGFAKEGGFAGVSFLPDFTFDGVTFDGETIYKEVDGDEIVILPRLDVRNLVRFALGYRGRQASIEVSYDRTSHDGTFLDLPGKATFQAVNVDGRYFFATRQRFQPHVLVGGTMPWFKVKGGSFLDPDTGDASFKGFGLNTEAGVTIYPHRQLGVSVGYNYRVLWFDRVTGVSDTLFELRPRFRETSGTVVVSTHLIF
jgi:Outer membrane protein beta-barrel domain